MSCCGYDKSWNSGLALPGKKRRGKKKLGTSFHQGTVKMSFIAKSERTAQMFPVQICKDQPLGFKANSDNYLKKSVYLFIWSFWVKLKGNKAVVVLLWAVTCIELIKTSRSVSLLSFLEEPWVCGWAVLSAELPGGGAAKLSPAEPLPVQPRRCDRDVLQPPKQEAQHTFTERQWPSTHAAFDSHADTQPRPAGAQHHPHPAS